MRSPLRAVFVSGLLLGLAVACGTEATPESLFGNGAGETRPGGDAGPQPAATFEPSSPDAAARPRGCKPATCEDAHANCGPIGDGCGGVVECGACTVNGETCGGGGVPSQCGAPACTKLTCAQQNVGCGAAADGCGGVLATCGTCDAQAGEFCGGGGPSRCGAGVSGDAGAADGSAEGGAAHCVTRTCTDLGANCGMQSDGCGGLIDCGTCSVAGQTCGGAGVPSRCGTRCRPLTACPVGQNCGAVADGCGGIVSCGGPCAIGTCGGAGSPNVCGTSTTCTGLCAQQTTCPGGGTTSLRGVVTSPNGALPVYGALVYVPTSPPAPFATGVSCDQCGAAAGTPLVSATTGPDGSFLLTNVPVSSTAAGKTRDIPLVVQLGRWRKQITVVTRACDQVVVPSVDPANGGAALAGGAARPSPDQVTAALPRNKAEGDIPLTAIATGDVDGLECVFRKIGIDDAEFTDPSGTGRIRFYQDNGAVLTPPSGTCSVSQASCTNYGGNCGSRCSASGRSCGTPGATCGNACSATGTTCTTAGETCGNRCSSNGSSCTGLGTSCDRGNGTCGPPLRCSSTNNRSGCGALGASCDSGRGTCVQELRCSSDGGRCDARTDTVGTACDGGRGACGVDSCAPAGTCTSDGTCVQRSGTPAANTLYNDPAELAKYDMTIFECVGERVDKTATQQANVRDYANKGGRVYATHFAYVWLYNAGAAPWNATASFSPDAHAWTSAVATIDTSFAKGVAFAQWLNGVGGLVAPLPAGPPPWNPPPKITIEESRHDVNDVVAPAQRWLTTTTADTPNVASVQHYTFNTDWTKPASEQCGRVLFSDFHVSTNSTTEGVVFPNECDSLPLTTQEKVLAFMLFDLASCVSPPPPPIRCTPRSCADQGIQCGQAGDGCGNVITCPNCPQGQSCGGAGVPNQCGTSSCAPAACPSGTCGTVADGCGGTSACAPCGPGQTCGGGPTPGVCGSGGAGCAKATCLAPALGAQCGPVADGCGGLLSCACPSGTSCINGRCATSACAPRSCAAAGANCGQVADGCGGLLECGTCLAPQECGGGGVANVCGSSDLR